MINQTDKAQLEKPWLVTRIVWSALFASLIVYLLVAKLLEGKLPPVGNMPLGPLKNILLGLALVIFVAAFFVRKALMGANNDGPSASFIKLSPQVAQALAAGRYIVAIIASAGMSESIGICGLVYYFLSQDAPALYLFIGMSGLAMFTYRPRREEFLQRVSDMQIRRGTPSA